ncbi:MAG: glycosyltransferase [Candidatus Paceibacterota bacterium]
MNNNNQKVSFVIPAYNSIDTLAEAVESIYNGNFEDGDEVIIVDNASTDATRDVIRKLKKRFTTIIEIDNPKNVGCPASRNIGVRRSKNPLIFNLDSDNVLIPGSIKRMKNYLLSENADMASFSEYHYFQKHKINKITHKWTYKPGVMNLADFLAGPINPGPGGNFMYTKKSWEKIGGYWEYGEGVQEAWGFTLKQLVNGAKFVVLPNSYYLHRYGINSLFVRKAQDIGKSSIMATKMILPYLHLLNDEDAAYIASEKGGKEWFEYRNYIYRPIRVKSGEVGTTGYKIVLSDSSFLSKIKRFIPSKIYNSIKKIYKYTIYLKEFVKFRQYSTSKKDYRFKISWKNRRPELNDKTADTKFDTHYIYHPAWAARIVKQINPEFHVDISSTLSFSSILSAFIPVKFYDFRPAKITLSDLESRKGDLLSLPLKNNSITSISCMHTVEHIGLGRYGDPIDPTADIKAIDELKRVTAIGGSLLFVIPIGKPKVIFNSHRVYSYKQIVSLFTGFDLKEFTLIPDNASYAGIIKNATEEIANIQNYGCGCFWFIKK